MNRLSRSKFGVFGDFQSRLQGFWSHLFRFRLQKTTYFISENRPNLTQKLDIDRQICIYVNCLARILSQNLKFGSTESRDCAVLNVFSYTGGFSLYAARGGACVVTSLDISKNALLGAERNFRMNQHLPTVAATEHRIIQGDAFQVLAQLNAANQQFDVVIIDPPSFAKQQSEIQNALKSYKHLTQLGLSVLRPTGLIVLASCSSRVRTDSFSETVHHAAYEIGRPLQVYQQTSHPLDHPVRFPEGAYLKCLFARA
ncbi:class I SAM-dependent methyltransferase [Chloroflexi bacterium TSY]|nr:class I SAM-dependent methyltransferase [Chloroflexi bacterium TSY]